MKWISFGTDMGAATAAPAPAAQAAAPAVTLVPAVKPLPKTLIAGIAALGIGVVYALTSKMQADSERYSRIR